MDKNCFNLGVSITIFWSLLTMFVMNIDSLIKESK